MQYKKIHPAVFRARPNRFVAQVEVDGRTETVPVKNTGRCRELLIPGVRVYCQRSQNPARKTKYDLTAVEKGISLKASDSHLRQVLGILLDNAMKYSAPEGRIWVKLIRHGGHCLLSVSSPGQEISPEDLQNIFKRFYRVDKARSRDGSYGLGLSIAQSIVLSHKGKIWAESEDGINTFFIQLPISSM